MTHTNDPTLTVSAGDVVLLANSYSYFHITDITDPTHPTAHGVVWHGHYWLVDARHWGPATVLHVHAGMPAPQVLSTADRAKCGWSDLT